MAQLFKCDRCGTIFEADGEAPPYYATVIDFTITKRVTDETGRKWTDIDLCPDCSEAFNEFLSEFKQETK